MKTVLAEHAGFCFGVRRAVESVYELSQSGKKIYTYGPIIHNQQVVDDLKERAEELYSDEEFEERRKKWVSK